MTRKTQAAAKNPVDTRALEGTTESGETLTLQVSFTYQTEDDRKRKSYGSRFSVHVEARPPKVESPMDTQPFLFLSQEVRNTFAPLEVEAGVGPSWGHQKSQPFWMTTPWQKVERPSHTLGVAATWGSLGLSPEEATEKLLAAALKAHANFKAQIELTARARQATSIRDWASEKTVAAAKEACRYSQRLAALRAELLSEVEQQTRNLEPSLRETLAAEEFHPKAVEVGLKAGGARARETARNMGGPVFHSAAAEIEEDMVR